MARERRGRGSLGQRTRDAARRVAARGSGGATRAPIYCAYMNLLRRMQPARVQSRCRTERLTKRQRAHLVGTAARALLAEGGALMHPTLARERVKCNRAHLAPRAVSLGGRRRPAEAGATGGGWRRRRRRRRRRRCRRLPHQLVHAGAFEEAARRKAAAEGSCEGIDRGRRARRRGDALKDAGDVL
eukprot:scaffold142154_cov118-Phaeocystis_antarctica.AAC.2